MIPSLRDGDTNKLLQEERATLELSIEDTGTGRQRPWGTPHLA